jgi:hypothetical protein
MQVSSVRGRADLDYNRKVVARCRKELLISDSTLHLRSEFSTSNYLQGGIEGCGDLPKELLYNQNPNAVSTGTNLFFDPLNAR